MERVRTKHDQSSLSDWFDALARADVKPKAVVVLGPDPFAANDNREVVAVYPPEYARQAGALARSSEGGAGWRAEAGPLVGWQDLTKARAENQAWAPAWLEQGALTMVRVDFPTAFRQGFECFILLGREISDGAAGLRERVAYTTMSHWPIVKRDMVSHRYDITAREMEVLIALAEGLTVKEACERVKCAERTIGFHLSNIQEKLRASNRAAVVQRACVLGLL